MMIYAGMLNPLSPLRKIFLIALIALSGMLLFTLVGLLVARLFFEDFNLLFTQTRNLGDDRVIGLLKYFQILSQIGLFIIPPLLFAWLDDGKIFNYLKLDRFPGIHIVFFSAIIVFAILPFLHWSAIINEMMHLPEWLNSVENWMKSSEQNAKEITDAFLSDTSASGLIINLIMIALLPALGEEFLFRGVLQKLLHQWFRNVHWAVIVSAVIFSAMHFQFYGFLPRTILGVLFGYLFVITKSLWIPITAHFINNGAAVVAAYLFQQQLLESDYHEFGRTTDFLWVLISAITVVALFFAVYHLSLHQNGQNQNIKGESPGPPP